MYFFLYSCDSVLIDTCSEIGDDLQHALNELSLYCEQLNITKRFKWALFIMWTIEYWFIKSLVFTKKKYDNNFLSEWWNKKYLSFQIPGDNFVFACVLFTKIYNN